MNCNCTTMYCSDAETSNNKVVLIPNRTVRNLTNTETYGLVICSSAVASVNSPVYISTNLGDIPVLCKAGNTMYANQLNTRVKYPIMYGNGNDNYANGQFVILSAVRPRAVAANVESV